MTPPRITPARITSPAPNEVVVFPSNLQGIHGAGMAKQALTWGAVPGQGLGRAGQTWALPTKETPWKTMSLGRIQIYVNDLHWDVRRAKFTEPETVFLIPLVGCGLAGYTPFEIAPLLREFVGVVNVALPVEFINILNR
jgi:hypothetical protein